MPTDSLDILRGLTSNVANPENPIQASLLAKKRLDDMKRNLGMVSDTIGGMDKWGNPTGTAFATGATPTDVQGTEDDLSSDPYIGTVEKKRVADIQAINDALAIRNRPADTAARNEDFAQKLGLAVGPAQATAAGQVAVEKEKNAGQQALQAGQAANTKSLLETLSGGQRGGDQGGNGPAGPGSTVKPTINATGGVSFTTTQMPALVQRARNQLTDARNKTLEALKQAENQYPGINDAAQSVDAGKPVSWTDFLTGGGNSPKYGSALDMAGAANDRLKYTMGVPTPFSQLAQESSFGNIEQMAGQLPGVRGLATITPLFKEHQSRWGKEAPAATVQRLRHMVDIMDDTLHTIDTGGGTPDQGGQ